MRREFMGIPFVVDDGLPPDAMILATGWKQMPGTTDGMVCKQVVMLRDGTIEEYEIRAKAYRRPAPASGEG